MIDSFVCSLYPQREFPALDVCSTDKVKDGKYLNSYFWSIKDYARGQWMVAFNVWCDWESYAKHDKKEIIFSCLEKINTPLTYRKKSKVLRPSFKYGNLKPHRASFKNSLL